MKRYKITAIYSCKHSAEFFKGHEPTIFDDVLCFRCNREVIVTDVLPQWHAQCTECRYNYYFGQDLTTTRRRAVIHANQKSHVVRVKYGQDVKDTVGGGMTVDDKLGLRDAARQQSAILRQITSPKVAEIVTISLPELSSAE